MAVVITDPDSSEYESFAARRLRLAAEQAAANAVVEDNSPRTVEELVERAGDLAALPQVVMRVIDLTTGTHHSAVELERVIGTDQALTARILTLANSSYYGLPRRISSIREAVVFLGFKSVRNLAMTVTSFNLFLGKSDADSLARRDLWKHSINTGLCGKIIASAIPGAGISEEVYTAALLHDIGKMLMSLYLPRPYTQAMKLARENGISFHRVEGDLMPFTHAEVGASLAMRWNLPPVLVEAIGLHHMPERAACDPKTCAAVSLANDMSNAFGDVAFHAEDGVTRPKPPDPNETAMTILELKIDALHRLSGACAAELRAGSALCSLL